MTDKIEVTQRARNAAIRLLEAGEQDWQAKEVRLKEGDHFPIVQAFARFERDILASTADAQPVAWMYERKGKTRIDHSPIVSDDMAGGWVATPLYTHPAKPVAAQSGDAAMTSAKDAEIAALQAELAEARNECLEQARLLGMGAERELDLQARLAEAREVPGKIAAWLREQRKDVPAHGWEFATAIEARDWSK